MIAGTHAMGAARCDDSVDTREMKTAGARAMAG